MLPLSRQGQDQCTMGYECHLQKSCKVQAGFPIPADVICRNPAKYICWFPWKPADVPPKIQFRRMSFAEILRSTSAGIPNHCPYRLDSMETGGCIIHNFCELHMLEITSNHLPVESGSWGGDRLVSMETGGCIRPGIDRDVNHHHSGDL